MTDADVMATQQHTLINVTQALAILTFVSRSGLYQGSRGTRALTRFPHGLYSKEECEALRDELVARGLADRDKAVRRISVNRPRPRGREIPETLI